MQQIHEAESKGSQDAKYTHDHDTVEYHGANVAHLESAKPTRLDPDHGYDPAEIKRIIRKVDWRLVPPLAALYAMSLIDRTNLSFAATEGMLRELRLTSTSYYQYAVVAL